MKKSHLVLLVILLFGRNFLSAQIQFEKVYGDAQNQNGNDVRQTSDGGYIEVGFTQDTAGTYEVYVVKTDMFGDTTWTKTISGGFGQVAFGVQEIDSGNFIITGYKNYVNSSDCDVNLIKLSANGNLIWQNPFGGPSCQWGQAIIQTSDGNFVTGGSAFYKRNSQGGSIWQRGIGFQIMSLEQTSDGGIILEGFTTSNFWLEKTDSSGTAAWTKSYAGTSYNPSSHSVYQTTDGGYILTGANIGFTAIQLIKTDSIGDTLWTKQIGNWSYAYGGSVQQTNDGGYIIAGEDYDGVYDGVYLVKTNAIGDTMWTRSFQHLNSWCWGTSVQQTTDGGYIISGSARDTVAGNDNFYLIKTDGIGNVSVHSPEIPKTNISVYPNPFHNSATVFINSTADLRGSSLHLLDVLGNEVKTIPVNGKETVIEKENLSPGIYFYRVENSGGVMGTGKIIVE